MKFLPLILSLALALGAVNAQAKRLGGGQSVGKQSNNVTQREAAPAAPSAPSSAPSVAPSQAAKPATPAPAAAAPKKPWGAMLGGLAAGLGLAWLAHSLGLGAEFGQFLMFGLLALAIMVAVGWFMRRKSAPTQASPFAFEGAGRTAPSYRPENVGNDASARPWEQSHTSFDTANTSGTSGLVIGSALAGSQNWTIPAGFDKDGFLASAKANFITLQSAWDRSDISSLRAMMTDEMLLEIQQQLAERENHTGASVNLTEVVMLEAQLLGIEDLGEGYMASVEFSGMIREEPSAGPNPFREVWNMTKPKAGNVGWLVAGVQALQ